MNKFTPESKKIIKRIEKVMAIPPKFNLKEITKCFERQYKLLGVEVPEIVVADDMVIGYKLAWGAARGAAWDAAWGAAGGVSGIATEVETGVEDGVAIEVAMADELGVVI